MKLEQFYRDIYSRLNLGTEDHNIYYEDIVKSINDVIRKQRLEYVKENLGNDFSYSEIVYFNNEDFDYPFLKSTYLCKEPLQEVPIQMVIIASNAIETNNELRDESQSFSKGDRAIKGTTEYEAISDIDDINTFNLTFNKRNAKNYKRLNGLHYNEGDIIFDFDSKNYYRVESQFTGSIDDTTDNIADLTRLYWEKKGSGYIYVSIYELKNLREMKYLDQINGSGSIAFDNEKVYATPNISRLNITYIPKWERVEDFGDDIDIPDYMVDTVKQECLQRLAAKLGIKTTDNEQ